VPALFAAAWSPGILAGLALIVPACWMARAHKMGALEASLPRPPFWKSCARPPGAWRRRC
jgi:TRAP-type C4-dicarboxylate transport system permease large subunit